MVLRPRRTVLIATMQQCTSSTPVGAATAITKWRCHWAAAAAAAAPAQPHTVPLALWQGKAGKLVKVGGAFREHSMSGRGLRTPGAPTRNRLPLPADQPLSAGATAHFAAALLLSLPPAPDPDGGVDALLPAYHGRSSHTTLRCICALLLTTLRSPRRRAASRRCARRSC